MRPAAYLIDERVRDMDRNGVRQDRAISFFAVRDGTIVKIVEFWPEPFAAAANRRHLVEPLRE